MWSLSYIIIAIGYFVILLFSNIFGPYLGIVVFEMGIGAMMTSSGIVDVLVMDYDYIKYNKLRTGKFVCIYNILFRANGILVGLAYCLTERFFGYVDAAQTVAVPDQAANFLFLYFPLLMILLGILLSQAFKSMNQK